MLCKPVHPAVVHVPADAGQRINGCGVNLNLGSSHIIGVGGRAVINGAVLYLAICVNTLLDRKA